MMNRYTIFLDYDGKEESFLIYDKLTQEVVENTPNFLTRAEALQYITNVLEDDETD